MEKNEREMRVRNNNTLHTSLFLNNSHGSPFIVEQNHYGILIAQKQKKALGYLNANFQLKQLWLHWPR